MTLFIALTCSSLDARRTPGQKLCSTRSAEEPPTAGRTVGGRRDYGAIGTVTNLAARLRGEATDGQILVSSRVATAAEGFAEAQEVGSLALKGLHRPVRTFNIVGDRGGERRRPGLRVHRPAAASMMGSGAMAGSDPLALIIDDEPGMCWALGGNRRRLSLMRRATPPERTGSP